MELKIRKNGEIYIIDVNGEMDLYNSYKLKELVMKMLEKNVHSFVINLEQVDYIDSSGIGALIYICSTIKKLNLKLSIANIHGSVKKVIELTKLMGYFPIANSVEEALLKISELNLYNRIYNKTLNKDVTLWSKLKNYDQTAVTHCSTKQICFLRNFLLILDKLDISHC